MQITRNGLGIYINECFLPYYGSMILLGLLVSAVIGFLLVKRLGKSSIIFALLVMCGLSGGFVGAKLLYLLIHWKDLNFSNWAGVMQSGFVFYGGIIGALVTLFFIQKVGKVDVLPYIQVGIACVPIAHGFGRIGCHLVGCCYGIAYSGLGAKVYTDSFVDGLNGRAVFPVQLTEAIWLFALGVMMSLYVWNKRKTKGILSWYLAGYALLRFCLEFLRGDRIERKIYGPFSTSQWISIFLIVGVIGATVLKRNKKQSAL